MPRKPSSDNLQESFAGDTRFKSYKNTGKGDFTKLVEGEEVVGVFLSLRLRNIKDRRTKLPKQIRVYSFRGADGLIFKVGSRALLDSCFDDIMDEHGGMNLKDNVQYTGAGIDWITNRTVKIIRGTDTETTEGDDMGTYEILVEEDSKG
jgi:hypothetical protein